MSNRRYDAIRAVGYSEREAHPEYSDPMLLSATLSRCCELTEGGYFRYMPPGMSAPPSESTVRRALQGFKRVPGGHELSDDEQLIAYHPRGPYSNGHAPEPEPEPTLVAEAPAQLAMGGDIERINNELAVIQTTLVQSVRQLAMQARENDERHKLVVSLLEALRDQTENSWEAVRDGQAHTLTWLKRDREMQAQKDRGGR